MITHRLSVLTLAIVAIPSPAPAQVRMSEASVISQTVDGTVITVSYSRPQLRGRPPGPDGVYHHEHMWTPGANWATTLEASRPITLNGKAVAAGKYSFWIETSEKDWTFHLHPEPRLFHTAAPKPTAMKHSFTVTPEPAAESVEMLTFDFPEVRRDGATLRFQWAKVVVPLRIEVEPSRKNADMTAQQAGPYLGGWTIQLYDESKNQNTPEMKMEMLLSGGALRGVVDGPQPWTMEFIPEPDGTFLLGFVEGGKVVEVETATPIVFELENGRATRWYAKVVKGIGDKSWIWGTRRQSAPP
jgi:hypothetical protein